MLLKTSFPNTKRNCKHYRTETMNVHMKTLNEWAKVCPGTCTFPLACYERFGERWLLCSGFTVGTSSQHRNIQCPKDSRMYLATKSKPFCWVNLLIYNLQATFFSIVSAEEPEHGSRGRIEVLQTSLLKKFQTS